MVYIICGTVIIVTVLLCFKGITFHKKMEVVERKVKSIRTPEMDMMEKVLNERPEIRQDNEELKPQINTDPELPEGMVHVIKSLQEVFGPEQEDFR